MLLLRCDQLNREGNLAVQVRQVRLPEHGEPLGDPQLGGRREVGRRARRRSWRRRRFVGGNAVAEEVRVGGQLAAGQPQEGAAEGEEGERRRDGHADDAEGDQGRVASTMQDDMMITGVGKSPSWAEAHAVKNSPDQEPTFLAHPNK